jgi:hypothetical protein
MTARNAPSKNTLAAKTVRPVTPAKPDRSHHADPPSMDEPDLQEMLRDPIMQRLMTSDGITQSQLLTLVAAARVRIESSRRRYAD